MPGIDREQVLLGQAVRALRASKQITQEQLSLATGIRTTYISDIERGARNPSWKVLVRLAAGLEVSLAELGRTYDDLARDDQSERTS